jgi:hypothetical protein
VHSVLSRVQYYISEAAFKPVKKLIPFKVKPPVKIASPSTIRILPAPENIMDVLDATFSYGAYRGPGLGKQIVKVADLKGGVVGLKNPRVWDRIKLLAEAIDSPTGFIRRLIIDTEGNVIEGQHRLEALRFLRRKTAPVFIIEDLAPGVDIEALGKVVDRAQRMHSDQRHQLLTNVFEAIKEEGTVAAVVKEFEEPLGFEAGWNSALSYLLKHPPAKITPIPIIGK